MSNYIFSLSRLISIVLVLVNVNNPNNDSHIYRDLMLITSLIIFYCVSKVYQKKRVIITPGYAIYFIVYFLIFSIGPYSYIYNQMSLDVVNRIPNAHIPDDHYGLYFTTFLILNILILLFILTRKTIETSMLRLNIKVNTIEGRSVLVIALTVLLPLSLVYGSTLELSLVTMSTYFSVSYLLFKQIRKDITFIVGFIFSIVIILSHLSSRFIAVEYIVPILFAVTIVYIMKHQRNNKIKFRYILASFSLGFLILIYGVVSEMYKLGKFNYQEFTNVLLNYDLLISWINRQLYRIIDIWSVLGGNIIEYTNINGYYYGITYIKVFSDILNFEYVSLPTISANLVGANYAQPGLLAEGYSNFGMLGAVMNLFIVFFIAEILFEKFIKSQNMFNLMMLCIPFTKVLIDGGSVNSIIFSIIFIIISFSPYLLICGLNNRYYVDSNISNKNISGFKGRL